MYQISFTSGLYPFKEGEDPSRMFAGEDWTKRTNKRFHYALDCQQNAYQLLIV
jgi:methylmalonyl-CoA mutase N-terminal domain/subunit